MLKELKIGQILKVKGIDGNGTVLNGTGVILNGIGIEGYTGKGEMSYEFTVGAPFPQVIILYKEGNKKRLYHLNPTECDNLLHLSNHIKKKLKDFDGLKFRSRGKKGGAMITIELHKTSIIYDIKDTMLCGSLIGRIIKLKI